MVVVVVVVVVAVVVVDVVAVAVAVAVAVVVAVVVVVVALLASHWLVALRTFYGQILSLAYSFFLFETSAPGLPGSTCTG